MRFLFASFYKLHSSYVPPEAWAALYFPDDAATLELPAGRDSQYVQGSRPVTAK